MTHLYTSAADGWISFVTPSRQLFVGEELVARLVQDTGENGTRELLAERLGRIRNGERDLYI